MMDGVDWIGLEEWEKTWLVTGFLLGQYWTYLTEKNTKAVKLTKLTSDDIGLIIISLSMWYTNNSENQNTPLIKALSVIIEELVD